MSKKYKNITTTKISQTKTPITKTSKPLKYKKYTNISISDLTPTLDLITSDSINLSNKDFKNLLSSFKYLSKSELALLLYIDYIQRYNPNNIDYIQNETFNDNNNPTNNNNLNVVDFCNLTGTCRASFYTAYKSLINKGIINKDLCNIVDTTRLATKHSEKKDT